MSKEYSFHNKQAKNINPSINTTQQPNKKNAKIAQMFNNITKNLIMQQYDQFLKLKLSDTKIAYLSKTQDQISKEIIATVGILQKSTEKEETAKLSARLEHLNTLHKKLKEEYTQLLKIELNLLYEGWPDLFEKILEGVDRETLEHVLTVFEEFQKGNLDSNGAVNQGIDYMTMKYNLPRDFFDRNAVNQFNESLHKEN